jgi:N-acetylneuraminic acid mutarotase
MRNSLAMLLVLVFLIASCLTVAKPAFSSADVAENTWVTKTPMRQARGFLEATTVNGKIYAIGGRTVTGTPQHTTGGVVSTNEEYDPTTDTWTYKKPMPTPRENFAIATYQNKVYCLGGYAPDGSATDVNEVYNPVTDTWETKASLPNPRYGVKANVVAGKIYLIGGYVGNVSFGYTYLSRNDVYDPATDSWTTKAAIPNAVSSVVSAVIDSKIYVIMSGLNQIYDDETDTWSVGTPLPSSSMLYARAGATTGVNASKRIYVFGGSATKVYDPITDEWTNAATVTTYREGGFSVATVNDVLYVIGGYTATYPDMLSLSMGAYVTPEAANECYVPFGYGAPDPSYDGNAPDFLVLSPANKTYFTSGAGFNFSDVALDFVVDEPVFSVHYVLDGGVPVEISGNATIVELAVGAHNVSVFGFDASGNMGTSETLYFTIEEPEPFPIVPVAAASVIVALVGVGLLVYFQKRKG